MPYESQVLETASEYAANKASAFDLLVLVRQAYFQLCWSVLFPPPFPAVPISSPPFCAHKCDFFGSQALKAFGAETRPLRAL